MTELDLTDGKIFLNKVTEKIRTRLAEVDASIEAGQKDIQSMNEYYWENYTEMDEYPAHFSHFLSLTNAAASMF